MLILLIIILTSILLSIIIQIIALSLREKIIKEREKITPFECGFSPLKKARRTFSLRFFITTIIFLIFDIEIALLLPLGVLRKVSNNLTLIKLGYLVTFILITGLLHEWKQGVLNWVN